MSTMNFNEEVIEMCKRIPDPNTILGRGAMMPHNAANSGSRKQMASVQLEHILPLMHSEVPYLQTGYESEFGRYNSTFIKTIDEYEVVAKISKFSFNKDHHYFLILRDKQTNEYTIIERIMYDHVSENYGYLFNNSFMDSCKIGDTIPANSTIKKSNAYNDIDMRCDGVNLLTTYMALEENKEDAIVISRSAQQKLKSPLIKKILIVINDNDMPLNLFGDAMFYKSFPNIGESTNSIVCAIRRENNEEAPYAQSVNSMQKIFMSDEKYIAKGKVVDINLWCNNPELLATEKHYSQILFYYNEQMRMYKEMVDTLEPLVKAGCKFSYDLQKAYAIARDTILGKGIRKEKAFSNTMLEIVLVEEDRIEVGDKLANRYGGKGVVSEIREDKDMPITENGNHAELIFNSGTCINRENDGQMKETSTNMCSSRIIEFMDTHVMHPDEMLEMYVQFISFISPKMAKYAQEIIDTYNKLEDDKAREYMIELINELSTDECIYTSVDPITESMSIDTINAIHKAFPCTTQYTTYMPQKDSNGNIRKVKARRKMTIGHQYIYRLKQYGEEKFSCTSLSSTNLRNENSKSISKKLYKTAHARTPVRFGEMETGNLGHCGMENVVVNLMLNSASPHGRRAAEELLTGDPFNIDIRLDDQASNRGVEILNAYLLTIGLELKFVKNVKSFKKPILFKPIKFMSNPCINNLRKAIFFDIPGSNDMYYLDRMGDPMKRPIKFAGIKFELR